MMHKGLGKAGARDWDPYSAASTFFMCGGMQRMRSMRDCLLSPCFGDPMTNVRNSPSMACTEQFLETLRVYSGRPQPGQSPRSALSAQAPAAWRTRIRRTLWMHREFDDSGRERVQFYNQMRAQRAYNCTGYERILYKWKPY